MQITNRQNLRVHVQAQANGVNVPLPTTAQWSSSDPNIATVDATGSADGSTCVIRTIDEAVGTCNITVTVGNVSAVLSLDVIADVAVITLQIVVDGTDPK